MSEVIELTEVPPADQMKLLYPNRPWESEPDTASGTTQGLGTSAASSGRSHRAPCVDTLVCSRVTLCGG